MKDMLPECDWSKEPHLFRISPHIWFCPSPLTQVIREMGTWPPRVHFLKKRDLSWEMYLKVTSNEHTKRNQLIIRGRIKSTGGLCSGDGKFHQNMFSLQSRIWMKKSVTLEHVDPMLEEVGHLHGPFGDRSVTSTEKQTVVLGHVPSVHFGAECSAASLPHFLFFYRPCTTSRVKHWGHGRKSVMNRSA